MKKIVLLTYTALLAVSLCGCAGTKAEQVHQRGWIGGEYLLAKPNGSLACIVGAPGVWGNLPKAVQSNQMAAVEITHLATNAPTYTAGLRKGDFVLEVNHRPMTSLQKFRRVVDRSKPGDTLAIKAYRDGKITEYEVPVGCEKYKYGGNFTIYFPTVVHRWDLWPNPGFSLVCIGYEPNPGTRQEFGHQPKPHEELYDEDWSAYLVLMELSSGCRVVAQEPVVAAKQE
jgi:hypothetical protein